MNHPRRTRKNDYYLDVTEFIMTQHRQFQVPSPHHTPLHHAQQPDKSACRFRKRIERKKLIMQITTPNNLPLVIEVGGVELSPYFRMGQGENLDIEFYDFTLEIPEEDQELSNDQNSMLQQQNQSDHDLQNSQGIQYSEHNDQYEISQYAPDVPPSRLNLKSFLEIYQELKKNQATENQLKQFIADYLTQEDLQAINIEECPLINLEQIVHNNLRYVGPISWLERKYKVQKYKEKKKNRIWKKKISYDCRKRVADNRLRVKGKFVTKKQACNILGVNQLEEQDIKQLLECQRSHSKSTQIK